MGLIENFTTSCAQRPAHNKNPLYCSTGTIISRYNRFDYTLMYRVLPPLVAAAGFDGYEFMMLNAFYEKTDEIAADLEAHGMRFSVFHAEKDIGTLFSDGTEESAREALRLFRINCALGQRLGAGKLVLHLWGGRGSDLKFSHNLSFVPQLRETAAAAGLELLIENVPCSLGDPISHWEAVRGVDPDTRFLYDTRFGEFHRQNDRLALHPFFTGGLVTHMHISDFIGGEREFTRLRPILHPGEGQIDFPAIFSLVHAAGYRGSLTLESPVAREDGTLDTERLEKSLRYIAAVFPRT